ncbi:MAG: putative addiction module antidote protein [Elusimicrobia bacterium]|nr:putative addiction module antidote protein [Elusimicrobiota bacterium]
MRPAKNYRDSLRKALRDPSEAAEYINAAIGENDLDTFLLALRDVAEAQGMAAISRRAKLNRVSLYKMLSHRGNPHLQSVLHLLQAAGLRLSVGVRPGAR